MSLQLSPAELIFIELLPFAREQVNSASSQPGFQVLDALSVSFQSIAYQNSGENKR